MSEYEARIKRWATRFDLDKLNEAQAQGYACVSCGYDPREQGTRRFVPVGYGRQGISSHVFACVDCDSKRA